MKNRALLPILFAVAAIALPADLGAADLTTAQFRKFKGRYRGEVSGIAGNTTLSSHAVRFNTQILVTTKNAEVLVPLISDLHANPTHRIIWRKPTGTTRRAKRIGVYTGTYNNGLVSGTVSGMRILNFSDRGSGSANRYTVRMTDTLREDAYSGQDISGLLKR